MSFIGMAIGVRHLSFSMGTFEILTLRSFVALAILIPVALRWRDTVNTYMFGRQFARNVVHFSGQYCWALGIALLPLSEVFALEFTMPIWVFVLAVFFLNEKLTKPRLIAVAGGFAGILLILRPGAAVFDPAAFIVLAAAIGFAGSVVLVKSMSAHVSSLAIVFWMTVMQLPMALFPALLNWVTPTWAHVPWIILVGVTGLSAHYTMAQALKLADATFLLPIDFLRVPLIAIVGFALFDEPISVWVFAGAALIFGANYYATIKERR